MPLSSNQGFTSQDALAQLGVEFSSLKVQEGTRKRQPSRSHLPFDDDLWFVCSKWSILFSFEANYNSVSIIMRILLGFGLFLDYSENKYVFPTCDIHMGFMHVANPGKHESTAGLWTCDSEFWWFPSAPYSAQTISLVETTVCSVLDGGEEDWECCLFSKITKLSMMSKIKPKHFNFRSVRKEILFEEKTVSWNLQYCYLMPMVRFKFFNQT